MATSQLTVFGFASDGASSTLRNRFAQFSVVLAKLLGGEVALFEASSYGELASAVVSQYVDVAWLPPIPFVALERQRAVVPLVHLRRGGTTSFRSALIVRADSAIQNIADLEGKRAAWVDRHSASGFVIPRIELAKAGLDVRDALGRQRFFQSHEAVVRAVGAGLADFGATYAGVAADGAIARGPWIETNAPIRVVALLGEIPGDVVGARADSGLPTRERLRDALLRVSREGKSKLLAHGAFGAGEFHTFAPGGYVELQREMEEASAKGLLDVKAGADESGTHSLL